MFNSKRLPMLLALIWLAAITILLVIPGTAFPSENWMNRIQLDKWVHIFLFTTLVVLWVNAVWKNDPARFSYDRLALLVAVSAVLYGIGMEIIQYYFVPFRSFELNDIFADLAGATIGYLLVMGRYRKK